MITIRYSDDELILCQGSAQEHVFNKVDMILTNPYGPIPASYAGKPMLILNFKNRKEQSEAWVGAKLELVSLSNHGKEAIWCANTTLKPVDLTDLVPDGDYMDIEMPLRLLAAYGWQGMRVWDGFMGRGTIGRACRVLQMKYIGVDRNPAQVEMAMNYLQLKQGVSA
jgi:hypothetical protein